MCVLETKNATTHTISFACGGHHQLGTQPPLSLVSRCHRITCPRKRSFSRFSPSDRGNALKLKCAIHLRRAPQVAAHTWNKALKSGGGGTRNCSGVAIGYPAFPWGNPSRCCIDFPQVTPGCRWWLVAFSVSMTTAAAGRGTVGSGWSKLGASNAAATRPRECCGCERYCSRANPKSAGV